MKNQQIITAQDGPLTIDGATFTLDPTPREIKLKTADNVRLEMSRVYREMRCGKVESGEGTKLVYVLGQIGKMIELVEIEERIKLLERTHHGND